MDIKKYMETAYKTACRNGFHDEEKPMAHWLMLVITEVSEAVEADRKRRHANVAMFERERERKQAPGHVTAHWRFCFELFIKDTVADEFADVCIRLFDFAATFGFELEEMDLNLLFERYVEKYGDKSFTQKAFELCELLTEENPDVTTVQIAVAFMQCWAKHEGINLEWHIEQKMKYNKLRSRMHCKQY